MTGKPLNLSDRYAVKITLYSGFHALEVVYFRYALPLRMITKWRWYFEYLQSLIKICFPREFVKLTIEPQSVFCGVDYIEKKSQSLLKYKRARLKREYDKAVNDDLFGYTSAISKQKIESLTTEIDQLENGLFEYYVPVTYINKVKFLLKPHDLLVNRHLDYVQRHYPLDLDIGDLSPRVERSHSQTECPKD